MPSRYRIRQFAEDSFYHVFNRGVEKRNIFLDEKDYRIFLYYLSIYLLPKEVILAKYPQLPFRLQQNNLSKDVELISYSLMPNHFHLQLKQYTKDGVTKLLKQLTNAYTYYFNQRYKRVGSLMQGRFKAVLIDNEELLLHISRYIHLNPYVSEISNNLATYPWSSYQEYILTEKGSLCKTDYILFGMSPLDYKKFVLDHADYAKSLEKIKHLLIDED